MEPQREEDVETQLDRLNEVIAKTLAAARQTVASIDVGNRSAADDSPTEEDDDRDSIFKHSHRISEYLLTDPGYYADDGEYSFDSDFHDFVEWALLKLERTQMTLEDLQGTAARTAPSVVVIGIQTAEVTEEEIGQMREEVDRLQTTHCGRFVFGPITVDLHTTGHQPSEPQHTSTPIWESVEKQKADLAAREKSLFEREQDLHAQLATFRDAKRIIEEQQERYVEVARKQNADAMSLKDRIEMLLIDQQESAFDLSSVFISEVPTVNYDECEKEMDAVRKQVAELNIEGPDAAAVKKEMDVAEDTLVRVLNGDDPRKLHLQITVVKNRLVQIRGKQVIRDAEKMANSINLSITVLENDRLLQKSKNRIKEQLIRRLTTPTTSPKRSPMRSPVRSPVRSPPSEVIRSIPPPVLTSLDSISSPLTSPKISFQVISTPKSIIPSRPGNEQLKAAEERNRKLRTYIREMQMKVEKFKAYEVKFVEEKAMIQSVKKRYDLLKEALDRRERCLAEKEAEVTEREDMLRADLARSLSTREAREFLSIRAKFLFEQQQKLSKDLYHIEMSKAEVKAAKEEANEVRRMLTKEWSILHKKFAQLEQEKKKVADSRNELEGFLSKLQDRFPDS